MSDASSRDLGSIDPTVANLITDEDQRQEQTLRLIASENYASQAVREATASRLTNKYCEGYPGRRYYQGQQVADTVEDLARQRACDLFGADHANIQPYSGSPANLAVYYALLELGDPILGMGLPFGGHLTHGWKVNFSGRFYDAHHYEIDADTERLDYDAIRDIAVDVQPKMLICGASAYPRTIDFQAFRSIADEVGALLVADIAHISGLVAAGVHPSPVDVADVVTTTTHKTLRGPRGGLILCKDEHAKAIDRAVFPALQGGPHMNAIAAAAVAFHEASTDAFKAYAQQVVDNARALGDALSDGPLRLISGGTDNHLLLIDVSDAGISGGEAATALEQAGIICNANSIPFDPRGPFDPSGIRLGTAALTSRGMGTDEMHRVATFILDALDASDEPDALTAISDEVCRFCKPFPIP